MTEQDDKIKMMGNDKVATRITINNHKDQMVESLLIKKDDVILLKGNWDQQAIQNIAKRLDKTKLQCMIVVLPDGMSFDAMPVAEFHKILKATEDQMEITEADEVSGD